MKRKRRASVASEEVEEVEHQTKETRAAWSLEEEEDEDAVLSREVQGKLEELVSSPRKRRKGRQRMEVVEAWLNSMAQGLLAELGEDVQVNSDDSATQQTDYQSALDRLGLGQEMLEYAGLSTREVQQLYSGLFVYSLGVHDLMHQHVRHSSDARFLMASVWRTYLCLLEAAEPELYMQAEQLLRTENARSLSAQKTDSGKALGLVQERLLRLEREIDRRHRTVGDSNNKCVDEREQIAELRAKLRDARESFEADAESRIDLKSEVSEWRSSHRMHVRQIAELESQYKREKRALNKYMVEIKRIDASLEEEMGKRRHLQESTESLVSHREEVEKNNETLKVKLQELSEVLHELQAQHRHATMRHDRLQNVVRELERAVREQIQSQLIIGEGCTRADDRIGELGRKLAEAADREAALSEQLAGLRELLGKEQAATAEAAAEREQVEQERVAMMAKSNEVAAALQNSLEKAKEHRGKIAYAKAERERLDGETTQSEQASEELVLTLRRLMAVKQTHTTQLSALREQLEKQEDSLAEAVTTRDANRTQAQELTARLSEVEGAAADADVQRQEEAEASLERISNLVQELKDLEQQVEEQQQLHEEYSRQVKLEQHEADELRSDAVPKAVEARGAAEAERVRAIAEVGELEQEVEVCKERIAGLEVQTNKLKDEVTKSKDRTSELRAEWRDMNKKRQEVESQKRQDVQRLREVDARDAKLAATVQANMDRTLLEIDGKLAVCREEWEFEKGKIGDECNELADKLRDVELSRKELMDRVPGLERVRDETQAELKHRQAVLARLHEHHTSLQQRLQGERARFKKVAKEEANVRQAIGEACRTRFALMGEADELTCENHALRAEIQRALALELELEEKKWLTQSSRARTRASQATDVRPAVGTNTESLPELSNSSMLEASKYSVGGGGGGGAVMVKGWVGEDKASGDEEEHELVAAMVPASEFDGRRRKSLAYLAGMEPGSEDHSALALESEFERMVDESLRRREDVGGRGGSAVPTAAPADAAGGDEENELDLDAAKIGVVVRHQEPVKKSGAKTARRVVRRKKSVATGSGRGAAGGSGAQTARRRRAPKQATAVPGYLKGMLKRQLHGRES